MIINKESLHAVSVGFKKIFNNALGEVETIYKEIAIVIDVSTMTVGYKWLGDMPKMREWIGDRVLKDLKAQEYSITKKDWEATIEVDRDEIQYDQLGVVKPRIQGLAVESGTHYDELLATVIEANGTCYDNKPFFAVDHNVGGVSFSNLGNKKLTKEAVLLYRKEMRGLVSDEGKNLKVKPTLLLVPTELEIEAKKICENNKINDVENEAKGLFSYKVLDDLADPDAWYMLDMKKPVRPFIMQKSKPITFQAMDNPDDENVFMRKKFRYGSESQDNAGYGLWQCAYKSTGDVA